MFKSDILFSGYYGQKNTGDDAFVEVSSWGAKKYWNKTNLRYLAHKSNLPQVKEHIRGYPFTIPKTYGLQRHLLLKNTKVLLSAGGSTFHDVPPGSIKELTLKYKNSLKIGAIGVSLGPFKSLANERKIVEYLKNMEFLALRDKSSYDFAESLNLDYKPVEAFDLAALLPNMYGDKRVGGTKELKCIGVSVCNYESYLTGADLNNEKRRNAFTIQLLSQLNRNKNFYFRFFIFNGSDRNGDEVLTKDILKKLKLDKGSFEIVPYDVKIERTWNAIQECDAMVSTRLHASIFACFANVPFFLIEYHKKCHDFLQDVGQEEKYRLFDGEVEVEKAVDQISAAVYGDYIPPKNLNEMKRKALLNFTSICFQ